MRTVAIGLLVAACAPEPTPSPIAQHAAVEPAKPVERTLLFDRRLTVGASEPTATRATWALTIDGNSATLVETGEETTGSFTLERADREAKWTTGATHVEKGQVRHVGDHIALDLAAPGDSLFMSCWHRSIVVAAAGARRVPTRGHKGDCSDAGAWSPATTTRIDALICSQGDALDDGQQSGLDGDHPDETLWRFVAAPGIEFVEENDDCFQSAGLRRAK